MYDLDHDFINMEPYQPPFLISSKVAVCLPCQKLQIDSVHRKTANRCFNVLTN